MLNDDNLGENYKVNTQFIPKCRLLDLFGSKFDHSFYSIFFVMAFINKKIVENDLNLIMIAQNF